MLAFALLVALGLSSAATAPGAAGGDGSTAAAPVDVSFAAPADESTPRAARTRRTGRLVAVGDVACAPGQRPTRTTCRQADTAALARRLNPVAVLGLGDLQYETGSLSDYRGSYDTSWGRLRGRTWPVPGNHEYRDRPAGPTRPAGYSAYFNGSPGVDAELDRPYVRRTGGWRVYLLDSNCEVISCEAEARWLRNDLRRHPRSCTLVAMHHPRWSTGSHGDNRSVAPLWAAATRNGVDVALAGHDHHYERFAKRGTAGRVARSGTRSFVVGTGGKSLYPMGARSGTTRYRQNTRFGVLELRLRPRNYRWRYVAVGGRVLDRGRSSCR